MAGKTYATPRDDKSHGTRPPLVPQHAAPPDDNPRPTATAPIPEHTRPRTHAERNS